jgi:hypothetical protein
VRFYDNVNRGFLKYSVCGGGQAVSENVLNNLNFLNGLNHAFH